MSISTRSALRDRDLRQMIALVHAHPETNLHVLDLPYWLCSPSVQTAANARLWEDADGALVGWAVWQQPWITLDYAIGPEARGGAIAEQIVTWGVTRFQEMAREHGRVLRCFIDARGDDAPRIALLERYGFARAHWHLLHLACPLDVPTSAASLPDGFTIRHLTRDDDLLGYVEIHRAAFDTTNMTTEWKARIVRMPQYVPDLDFVVVAPDGRFAAFCVCWLHDDAGQIEPLGVHPDFVRRGLGRALLREAFRRLRAHGATTAHIEVYHDNQAARQLYESVGFHVTHTVWKYGRELLAPCAIAVDVPGAS